MHKAVKGISVNDLGDVKLHTRNKFSYFVVVGVVISLEIVIAKYHVNEKSLISMSAVYF